VSGSNHFWGDRHPLPADQVGAALGETKLHWPAMLIAQRAGVIAEQARVAGAAGQADVLLDLLLRHLLTAVHVAMVWQPPAELQRCLML